VAGRRPEQGRARPAPRRRHGWGLGAGMIWHGCGETPATASVPPFLTACQVLPVTRGKLGRERVTGIEPALSAWEPHRPSG
jgi:hypothetical protein